jgi:Tfp pilus assembly protein PilN
MVDINLLPWRENHNKKYREKILLIYALNIVGIFCVFFIVRFYLFHQLAYYKNLAEEKSIAMHQLSSSERNLLSVAKFQHQCVVLALLTQLSSLHEAVYLTEVLSKGKMIQIKGEANLFSDIKRLMSELLQIQKIDFVKLVALKSDARGLHFELQLMEQ